MDRLAQLIADHRADAERLAARINHYTRELELIQARLTAYEQAAELRPVEGPAAPRRGRQPGAISKEWQQVLRKIAVYGFVKDYGSIYEIALHSGIDIDPSSARDRVRSFVQLGYLLHDQEHGFAVTPLAISRFGFDGGPEIAGESLEEVDGGEAL
jgi:hypothetical protein